MVTWTDGMRHSREGSCLCSAPWLQEKRVLSAGRRKCLPPPHQSHLPLSRLRPRTRRCTRSHMYLELEPCATKLDAHIAGWSFPAPQISAAAFSQPTALILSAPARRCRPPALHHSFRRTALVHADRRLPGVDPADAAREENEGLEVSSFSAHGSRLREANYVSF